MTQDTYQSQCDEIRKHLLSGKSITQREAISEYGCYRLGARIHDLRAQGMDIKTMQGKAKNSKGKTVRFAVYQLGEVA